MHTRRAGGWQALRPLRTPSLRPPSRLWPDPFLPAAHSSVAFRIYDADADGYVCPADLVRQLQATNRRGLSPAQLEQVVAATVAEFDADKDGRLCYDEFRALAAASGGERAKALAF